jgi:hypothetical protein
VKRRRLVVPVAVTVTLVGTVAAVVASCTTEHHPQPPIDARGDTPPPVDAAPDTPLG